MRAINRFLVAKDVKEGYDNKRHLLEYNVGY